MYNISGLMLIIIMIAFILGISLQHSLVNDIQIENKVVKSRIINTFILIIITFILNNVILLLLIISILLINNNNNKILITHAIILIINTIIISNQISYLSILFMIICIDILSVLNIILIRYGTSIWYYFLYQGMMTILLWLSYIYDMNDMIILIYYFKLGAGIGGYYLPGFYSAVINKDIFIMIYIGITNIILMYNPINIFTIDNNNNNTIFYHIINFICIIIILILWIYNSYLFYNIYIFALSISSLLLTNIFYIVITISNLSYHLSFYLYFFTFFSICIWIVFLLHMTLFNKY